MKSVEDERGRNKAEGTSEELEIGFRRAEQAKSRRAGMPDVYVCVCAHVHCVCTCAGPAHTGVEQPPKRQAKCSTDEQ